METGLSSGIQKDHSLTPSFLGLVLLPSLPLVLGTRPSPATEVLYH